jgi:hypothetical protein
VHVVITYKRRIFRTAGTVAKQNADTIIFANDPGMNATNDRTQPDYATHSIAARTWPSRAWCWGR